MEQHPSIKKALNRILSRTHVVQNIGEGIFLSRKSIWIDDEIAGKYEDHVVVKNHMINSDYVPQVIVEEYTVEGVQSAINELNATILLES